MYLCIVNNEYENILINKEYVLWIVERLIVNVKIIKMFSFLYVILFLYYMRIYKNFYFIIFYGSHYSKPYSLQYEIMVSWKQY